MNTTTTANTEPIVNDEPTKTVIGSPFVPPNNVKVRPKPVKPVPDAASAIVDNSATHAPNVAETGVEREETVSVGDMDIPAVKAMNTAAENAMDAPPTKKRKTS